MILICYWCRTWYLGLNITVFHLCRNITFPFHKHCICGFKAIQAKVWHFHLQVCVVFWWWWWLFFSQSLIPCSHCPFVFHTDQCLCLCVRIQSHGNHTVSKISSGRPQILGSLGKESLPSISYYPLVIGYWKVTGSMHQWS